jgi:hypothetical protein
MLSTALGLGSCVAIALVACGGTPTQPAASGPADGAATADAASPHVARGPGCGAALAAEPRCNTAWVYEYRVAGHMATANAVTVDGNGDVIVGIQDTRPVKPGPGIDDQAVVVKLDGATGALVWHAELGGAGYDAPMGVAVDPSGDVIVSGRTTGETPLGSPGAKEHAFVAKLAGADGRVVWNENASLVGVPTFLRMGYDAAGRVVGVGGTHATAFSTSDRTVTWSVELPGVTGYNLSVVITAATGDVIVGGSLDGALPGQTSAGNGDGLVAMLSQKDGSVRWLRQLGTTGYDSVAGLAVDASGAVLVAGSANGLFSDSTGPDPIAAKLSSVDGAIAWQSRVANGTSDSVQGLSLDANGNFLLAGDSPVGSGPNDIDIWTLSSKDGSFMSVDTFGTAGRDAALAVAADLAGNPVVAGYSDGPFRADGGPGDTGAFVSKRVH